MTTIPSSPVGQQTPSSGSGGTTANSFQMTPNDFMNLFLTQLKNQNPTSPMDSSTMLQTMASMGSMSTSAEMSQKMDSLAQTVTTTLGNSQVLDATQLIGKKVEVESGVSPLTADPSDPTKLKLSGSAEVPAAASDVTVTITDSSGNNVVKTIPLGAAQSGGLMDFAWDGNDANGKPLTPGYYKISATATIAGKVTPIGTAGAFDVKSVALGSNGVILNLDGLGGKDMGSVIKIL